MNTMGILLGFASTAMTVASIAFGSWAIAALFFCMLVMLMAGEIVDAIKERQS